MTSTVAFPALQTGDALIVVDVQNDFLPGGALGVRGGDQVVLVLNDYLRRFERQQLPIFATRDWHPPGHCSFRSSGGQWPSHCVAGTAGAQFAPALALPSSARIISKGSSPDEEAYSGFAGTDLAGLLGQAGARRLFVGGLATDYCVLHTVEDALRLGFQVVLLLDAIRAVEVAQGDGARAIAEMVAAGAVAAALAQVGTPQTLR